MSRSTTETIKWWRDNISGEEQHRIVKLLEESTLSNQEWEVLLIQCIEEMRREEEARTGWHRASYSMPPF